MSSYRIQHCHSLAHRKNQQTDPFYGPADAAFSTVNAKTAGSRNCSTWLCPRLATDSVLAFQLLPAVGRRAQGLKKMAASGSGGSGGPPSSAPGPPTAAAPKNAGIPAELCR